MHCRFSAALVVAAALAGCSGTTSVKAAMYAQSRVERVIHALAARGVSRVQAVALTPTKAQILYRLHGRQYDLARTSAGDQVDHILIGMPPGGTRTFPLSAINAAAPERLILAVRRRPGDASFQLQFVGIGASLMTASGTVDDHRVAFESNLAGTEVEATAVLNRSSG